LLVIRPLDGDGWTYDSSAAQGLLMLHDTDRTAFERAAAGRMPVPLLPTRGLTELAASLAQEMPLRIAAAAPDSRPDASTAAIRLKRFTAFHPAFAAAALVTTGGRIIARSDFRDPCGKILPIAGIADVARTLGETSFADAALAAQLDAPGCETILAVTVTCPSDEAVRALLICCPR
jgi:hypothetical protein